MKELFGGYKEADIGSKTEDLAQTYAKIWQIKYLCE